MTPKGIPVRVALEEKTSGDGWAECAVRKDAGDDYDVTNGILVYARAEFPDAETGAADHAVGSFLPQIVIDGGIGIGRVTKPGLDQPAGAGAAAAGRDVLGQAGIRIPFLERLDKNPLRILDCKCPECKEIAKGAPVVLDFLGDDCRTHFEGLKQRLAAMEIPYTIDPTIVRGLDYYTDMIRRVKSILPGTAVKAFTAIELSYMIRKAGLTTQEGLRQLKQAGMDAIPGGGAEIFDERIRQRVEERRRQGMTQQDVADITGILPSNLARLESGKRVPTLVVLQKYASE